MKILLVKLGAIGDVCMATPLAASIKKKYPEAVIDWLTVPWSASVLENNPHLRRVITYDPPWQAPKPWRSYVEAGLLVLRLRKERYDIAIVGHRSGKAVRMAQAMGVPRIIAFEEGSGVTDSVPYASNIHEVTRNLALLKPLDIKAFRVRMEISLDKSEKTFAQKLWSDREWQGSKVAAIGLGGGVNPGLTMHAKRWSIENYISLGKWLSKNGYRLLLVGSASDKEIAHTFRVQVPEAVNMVGKCSLRETAALLKQADLYIGNDSGPLFIAAAVGTPTLSIFGPSDPRLVAPVGGKHVYAWNQTKCAPCYHPDSVHDSDFSNLDCDWSCMEGLTVNKVTQKIKELIKND